MNRILGIALSASLGLTALAAVAPTTVHADHGALRIVTHRSYIDSLSHTHIVGVVSNDTAARHRFVQITATFYNSSGQVVDTDFTFTTLGELVPHATSPFHLISTVPPGYASYSLTVSGSSMTGVAVAPLTVAAGPPFVDGIGALHIPGQVHNRSSHSLQFTKVAATLYSGSTVLTTDFTFTQPHQIGPNGSAPFEMIVLDQHAGYTHVYLQAEADADSSAYAASWDNYFGDLGATQFLADIVWLGESGITGGCGTGLYCPDDAVNREQMASFLVRALGLPPTSSDFFTDDETSIHEPDINALAAAGVAAGCGGGRYCPLQVVNREQMASFLVRGYAFGPTGTDFFTDDETSIHESDINRLAASGTTGGCGGTRYCPLDAVTRGQMAAFLHRAET